MAVCRSTRAVAEQERHELSLEADLTVEPIPAPGTADDVGEGEAVLHRVVPSCRPALGSSPKPAGAGALYVPKFSTPPTPRVLPSRSSG